MALGGCVAHFGTGDDWATLYDIKSSNRGKGEAQRLLLEAKDYYQKKGLTVGGSVALNPIMEHIYKKLDYKVFD